MQPASPQGAAPTAQTPATPTPTVQPATAPLLVPVTPSATPWLAEPPAATSDHAAALPTAPEVVPPQQPSAAIRPPSPAPAPGAAANPAAPAAPSQPPAIDTAHPSVIPQDLLAAIGQAHIYPDAKTAVDAIPNEATSDLTRDFEAARTRPGFNMHDFVTQHFAIAPTASLSYRRKPDESVMSYIDGMWDVLTRKPDAVMAHSSLVPLPYAYVVPGGRFSELYYWDSYFTMIGLYESQRIDLMRGMVRDMASLIDRYGHVPNGTRAYYLSRSEPPMFALMVDLLAEHDGDNAYRTYLPELQSEYDYWMEGAKTLPPGQDHAHVVRLPDGALLNRYWDAQDTPRDESYPEDIATAALTARPHAQLWRDLRAGSESGWDFSSRWLADGHTLGTIHTTEILPVDLNALMAHLEQALAYGYAVSHQAALGEQYSARANARIAAINRYLWSQAEGTYLDYDWTAQKPTGVRSGAMAMPLFLRLSSPTQATKVGAALRDHLLQPGGLTATDRTTGQQWDAPNGWAPLQWIAIKGLLQAGQPQLASTIAYRWMNRVISTYEKSGVLLEKYDVVAPTINPRGGSGGGEYPMQIGFGWTNGTLIGLMNRFPALAKAVLAHNPLSQQDQQDTPGGEELPSFVDYSHVPLSAAPITEAPTPERAEAQKAAIAQQQKKAASQPPVP